MFSHSSLLFTLSSFLGALRRLRPAKACLRTLRRLGGSGLAVAAPQAPPGRVPIWAVGPVALPCAGGFPPQRPPPTTRPAIRSLRTNHYPLQYPLPPAVPPIPCSSLPAHLRPFAIHLPTDRPRVTTCHQSRLGRHYHQPLYLRQHLGRRRHRRQTQLARRPYRHRRRPARCQDPRSALARRMFRR